MAAEAHLPKKKAVVVEGQKLSEDLIEEILLHLPVKSLLRFRCVCKSWFRLIKSSHFTQRHFNCHKSNDDILIFRRDDFESPCFMSFHSYESFGVTSPNLEMPPVDYSMLVDVGDPCNGLICISDIKFVVLCNPAMREFKVLPPLPFKDRYGKICVRHYIGLGFDSIRNDYKVVVVFASQRTAVFRDDVQKAAVYNLSTNSWREIHCDSRPQLPNSLSGTLFKGALHWVLMDRPKIISFDIRKEVFQEKELPCYVDERKFKNLVVLNKSLTLFAFDSGRHPSQFDIWKMHENGVAESWTKEFTIGPLAELCEPLLLWKNEAIILAAYTSEAFVTRLVTCAINTHKMHDLNICGVHFSVMIYRGSLISIK